MTNNKPAAGRELIVVIKNLFSRIHHLDRKLLFFLVFVFISTMLWLMNTLSKNYITQIDFPIQFYNIPENFVMVGDKHTNVQLQVSGRGFTLLKYTIGDVALPFNIDLQSYFTSQQIDKQNVRFQYYLSSKKEQIERFLNDEIKVLDVTPSTIQLQFDRLQEKKVKVVPVTDLSWASQYRKKEDFITSHDSVIVRGAQSVIDTINKVKTETITDENINSNKTYIAQLIVPVQCRLSRKKVEVKVKTERFTENTIKIPIEIINKPDTLSLTIFPDKINVTYLISFEDYEIVKKEDFKAAIDYNDIRKQNTPQKLNVNLLYVPQEAQVIRYWPRKARFIINEK